MCSLAYFIVSFACSHFTVTAIPKVLRRSIPCFAMFCAFCATPTNVTDNYCRNCGKTLSSLTPPGPSCEAHHSTPDHGDGTESRKSSKTLSLKCFVQKAPLYVYRLLVGHFILSMCPGDPRPTRQSPGGESNVKSWTLVPFQWSELYCHKSRVFTL